MVSLNMGIGAVNAFKRTPSLGLQVQHAAVLQVKLEVGRIGIDPAGDISLPGLRERFLDLRGDDARYRSGIFPVFDGIQ